VAGAYRCEAVLNDYQAGETDLLEEHT